MSLVEISGAVPDASKIFRAFPRAGEFHRAVVGWGELCGSSNSELQGAAASFVEQSRGKMGRGALRSSCRAGG